MLAHIIKKKLFQYCYIDFTFHFLNFVLSHVN